MRNLDQWNKIAEMLGDLIAKYADILDIESMQDYTDNSNIKDIEKDIEKAEKSVA